MTDRPMIYRDDAVLAVLQNFTETAQLEAIAALDPVHVGVKPLEWFEVEKYRYGGKYTSEGYTIRYIEGFFILDFAGNGKTVWRFPTLEAAKAAAQADYESRIRSALTKTPVQVDAAHIRAEALREAAAVVEAYDRQDGGAAKAILALIDTPAPSPDVGAARLIFAKLAAEYGGADPSNICGKWAWGRVRAIAAQEGGAE